MRCVLTLAVFAMLFAVPPPDAAQPFDPALYAGMRWRMIGPFRGGRTVGAAGIAAQPNVFYIGVNNGGVWKSTDYGRVWRPLFDDQPTGSIGALAIAPSDAKIIYVGSGEGLQRPDLSTGDGIYKSTDAGATWHHLGLRDGQQISAIIIDPNDARRVFVAVLGHPYGPNTERGVFRTINGGQNWQKVLYKDENTGGVDLAFDPSNAREIYAVLWAARQAPWEIGGSFHAPGSGLFKSTDGGDTWQPLTSGLPTIAEGLGRIGIGIAPSDPNRIYALVEATPAQTGSGQAPGRNLHHRPIAQGCERDLGRHGRWPDSHHTRRRQTPERHHSTGADAVEQGTIAARSGKRLFTGFPRTRW